MFVVSFVPNKKSTNPGGRHTHIVRKVYACKRADWFFMLKNGI